MSSGAMLLWVQQEGRPPQQLLVSRRSTLGTLQVQITHLQVSSTGSLPSGTSAAERGYRLARAIYWRLRYLRGF